MMSSLASLVECIVLPYALFFDNYDLSWLLVEGKCDAITVDKNAVTLLRHAIGSSPDTIVDDAVLDKTVIVIEDCKSVEKLLTTIVDTEKCCIKNCCLDKKRCDDD
ncbi:hypothetical protein Tco_0014975 [Tanacetum coccineum]